MRLHSPGKLNLGLSPLSPKEPYFEVLVSELCNTQPYFLLIILPVCHPWIREALMHVGDFILLPTLPLLKKKNSRNRKMVGVSFHSLYYLHLFSLIQLRVDNYLFWNYLDYSELNSLGLSPDVLKKKISKFNKSSNQSAKTIFKIIFL